MENQQEKGKELIRQLIRTTASGAVQELVENGVSPKVARHKVADMLRDAAALASSVPVEAEKE